ncbi:DUF1501 domain-containing protein [Paracoccaceae bacterium Fryx2]|nr:DUF1501 domain-containing protein [Paracoccaceae bacterium Fryx2]
MTIDRRFFLRGLTALGCSAAAHPFLTTVTLAAAGGGAPLGDHRLVVIILRGAMDGLDVVQPLADPLFAQARPTLGVDTGALDLDGYFALNPSLKGLMALWAKGELGFAHAVSTPYRDKRSHFDGQDLLEAGTGTDVGLRAGHDGWLNRMLQAVPGLVAETAFAVGRDAMPLLDGPAPVRNWTPDLKLSLSSQSQLLLDHVYHEDALFRDSAQEAMELAAEADRPRPVAAMVEPAATRPAEGAIKMADVDRLVDFAAERLRGETRIAAFSQTGWDTHKGQRGAIPRPLLRLERTILRLRDQLGPDWGKTTVLAMTEFGRTVRENGSRGTDHGTGGVMLMAGGAIRGGRVLGRWPGLAEADLYDRRDLMPTSDVRAWAAWAMRDLYGFDRNLLETKVFPGLAMGDDPKLIL